MLPLGFNRWIFGLWNGQSSSLERSAGSLKKVKYLNENSGRKIKLYKPRLRIKEKNRPPIFSKKRLLWLGWLPTRERETACDAFLSYWLVKSIQMQRKQSVQKLLPDVLHGWINSENAQLNTRILRHGSKKNTKQNTGRWRLSKVPRRSKVPVR